MKIHIEYDYEIPDEEMEYHIKNDEIKEQIEREKKWAIQRIQRGWDDRVVWSVDCWMNDIMPDILAKLKEDKQGIPMLVFDGMIPEKTDGNYSDEQCEIAKEKWNNKLEIMINGFLAAKRISDIEFNWKNKDEEKELISEFEEGMKLFTKYYFSLWD